MENRKGQSLIEILVAIGVGTIMLVGAITALAPIIKSSADVNRSQVGAALGKEILDNVRIFAEANWHNLDTLATTSVNKYFLNAATSTFLIATGTESVPGDEITSGLVGYWKFDDASGTQVMDFSPNRSNGTWYGTSTQRYATGTVGFAGKFNGTGDYLDIGSNSITGTSAFTLSAWINTTSLSNYSGAISIGSSATGQLAYIGTVAAAQVGTSSSIGGGFYGANYGSGDFSINRWAHVVMTFAGGAGGAMTIYVNGISKVSAAYTPNLGALYRRIGRIGSDTSYDFSGKVDDARVYNRALTASEIFNIYNANIFYRDFYVDDVYRDSGGNIVTAAGGLDPSTKKVTVEYYWGLVPAKTLTVYLTRSGNRTLWQTDWSGGANASGPASSTGNTFSTSSGINFSTSSGAIRINGL